MGHGGRVTRRDDRFLVARPLTPVPAVGAPTSGPTTHLPRAIAARAPAHRKQPPQRTVVSELARLYRTHQIDQADYGRYSTSFSAALSAVKHLGGTRATELEAVIENLHGIAAAGQLTPSRLPVLFLTLDRNRQWWTTGPLLGSGQDVEFTGSQLVWEYYPGQGIELQVLGTFGKANGLYTAGPTQYAQMRSLLGEMIPLAAQRGGSLVWEYYFKFDGGSPPWTSAMAQATGLEALTRASQAFGPAPYLQIAQQALRIFTIPPPLGVQVGTSLGARYLQYSFAPHVDIINAFLQALIGLYDYAHASGNPLAQRLFAVGDAQARTELPRFDTGAWSLYQPGVEDSLDYHMLVTGFLDQLCSRTSAPVYCTTAQHFHTYTTTPPALKLLTMQARAKRPFAMRFSLSKYSHVGIVLTRGQNQILATSANFPYGVDLFEAPALPAGTYGVRLAATDLPGNFSRIIGALVVSRH
jgi:hypothetical protein